MIYTAVVQARQFTKRDSTISSEDKQQGAQEWTETPAERDERLRLGKRTRAEDDLKTAPVMSRQEEETKRLLEEYNVSISSHLISSNLISRLRNHSNNPTNHQQ